MKKILTLCSALFCASFLFADDLVVANFDDVIPTYDVWGAPEVTATVETPAANDHGDAMLLTTTASNSGNSGFWLTCGVTAGTYNTLAFNIKSDTNPCKFYIKLEYTDADGNKSTVKDDWPSYTTADGAWQEFTMDITDKSMSTLVIQLAPWQGSDAFSCYLDDVVLRNVETGISKENANKMTVYANQAGSINVNLGEDVSFAKIKMFTSDGKLIYNKTTSASEQIDAKSLNVSGLVFVNVTTDKNTENFKVLVK
jgi:hypothetical protein